MERSFRKGSVSGTIVPNKLLRSIVGFGKFQLRGYENVKVACCVPGGQVIGVSAIVRGVAKIGSTYFDTSYQ